MFRPGIGRDMTRGLGNASDVAFDDVAQILVLEVVFDGLARGLALEPVDALQDVLEAETKAAAASHHQIEIASLRMSSRSQGRIAELKAKCVGRPRSASSCS